MINVTSYGAKGDGVTDDREAIQAAIDAASAMGGGIVFVPPGVYMVSRNSYQFWCLRVPSRVVFAGAGAASIIKQAPGIGPAVRCIYATGEDAHVADMTLDGNKENQAPNEHRHGVFADLTTRLTLERVTARNFTGDGFYLYQGATNTTFSGCHATANGRNGITLGSTVTECMIRECLLADNAYQQLDSEPGVGSIVSGVSVYGCMIDCGSSKDYAVTCSGASSASRGSKWVLTGNTIRGAVRVVWCDDVVISGNVITNPTQMDGIQVYRTCSRVSVVGNQISQLQTERDYLAAVCAMGTGIGSAPRDVLISGNTIFVAKASGFGVRAQTCHSVMVTSNMLRGAGQFSTLGAGVYVRSTQPGDSFRAAIVRGNVISDFGMNGVHVEGPAEYPIQAVDISSNTFDLGVAMPVGIRLDRCARQIETTGNVFIGGTSWEIANDPRAEGP